ncbi:S-methyl-5'-thioadenosine phosphorylase [Myxococcota bacterium]|nr:S-methyl-5'-thioadenosine phosphorylase [Myxococcota bacterium]MBU1431272.1 S-methyl-5'-thioadenosine phosphorylase [Myxococcota bacterium]MBU1900464.1 S-methyl-5'-thioadenosine phosphorylase [Myxococcota bacterium]
MAEITLGVIGGSGLYEIAGLTEIKEITLETPFGAPSDAFITGKLGGVRCVFLPRHGRGHRFTPSEVNYRANIWGLKKLGARFVLSVSAVGSLRGDIAPGDLVCPDQLLDRTRGRANSFFGEGVVAHVPFGDPLCPDLRALVYAAAQGKGARVHNGGTYVCIEGPSFSTKAESELFRRWGCSVVGMTNLPEARLAREAELAYATLALSTDYDCWHSGHDAVTVEAVVAVVKKNVETARAVIRDLCARLEGVGDVAWPAHRALAGGGAVMTARDRIPEEAKARLDLLLGRYLWPEENP